MSSIHADPDPDRMKTRSIAIPTLVPNGKSSTDKDTLDNEKTNKTISELYGDDISMIMDNDKKLVIQNLKHKLNSEDITIEEYRIKIFKLKTKVTDMVKKIDGLRGIIKEQDKRITNQSVKASIANQEKMDSIEQLEKYNKLHLKETLKKKGQLTTINMKFSDPNK